MKTAILLHGTGGSDQDYFWFADTKQFLEGHDYEVWWPMLPNTEKPELIATEDFVVENWPGVDEETIFIGHSSACPLILHILQNLTIKIKQAILVAGFYQPIDDEGFSELMLPKEGFDFEAIKQHAAQIALINSNDDPWGCDDKQARPVAEQLGATFILAEGQGHMGSLAFDQPYSEFQLVKDFIQL
jgi:predicted alpha/beta hydrolase family esterase